MPGYMRTDGVAVITVKIFICFQICTWVSVKSEHGVKKVDSNCTGLGFLFEHFAELYQS